MSFENAKSITSNSASTSSKVKRGAVNPTLPQNDSIEQRNARREQIETTRASYQWTTDVQTLPGVPLATQVPQDDQPSQAWWFEVLDVAFGIIWNIEAVHLKPIFSVLSDEAKNIIGDALEKAHDIEKLVLAIRKAVYGKSPKNELDEAASKAEQDASLDTLQEHHDVLRDIIDVLLDVIKAEEKSNTKSIENYRALFDARPVPEIGYTFQNDDEFARLRVAGPNPMLIKGISGLPENFPVTAAQYSDAVPGDDLDSALADGRVFLNDYGELDVLVAGVWNGQAKYVFQPMALFAVPPGGSSLKPVAIQCGQDPSQYPVMTPTVDPTRKWGWEMAKFVVQVADCNYHELFVHLAGTHLVSETIAVATRRNLAEVHPLWSLLVPHFEGTLFINNLAVETLISKGGPIDAFFGGTITSSQLAAVKGRLSFDFYGKMLPSDMAKRNVDDCSKLSEYPYRDDAQLVWDAIQEWAGQYINHYYADDEAVTGDTELAQWANAIAHEGHMLDFGPITSRRQLTDVCTMIIFTASAQHAAVNFPQESIMTFAPAVTGAGWSAAPNRQDGHSKQDWVDAMPPMSLALEQLSSLVLLGSVYYRPLGQYDTNRYPYEPWFQDEEITGNEGPLARFQAGLREVEERIIARNQRRMHSYTYLQPSLIPTSTNI